MSEHTPQQSGDREMTGLSEWARHMQWNAMVFETAWRPFGLRLPSPFPPYSSRCPPCAWVQSSGRPPPLLPSQSREGKSVMAAQTPLSVG